MRIFISLFSLLLLTSCSMHHYTLDNLPAKRVEFGSVNGLSGMRIGYTLLQNGQIFYSNGFISQEAGSIERKEAKWFFQETDKLRQKKYQFREDGSLCEYIRLEDGLKSVEWIWPAGRAHPAPPPLLELQKRVVEVAGRLKKAY